MSFAGEKPKFDTERKYQRYHVSYFEGIRARVDMRNEEKVVCLGQGGCGFYGYQKNMSWIPPTRVTIELQLGGPQGEVVEVFGDIIYVRPHLVGQRAANYYGVEFHQASVSRLNDLSNQLYQLCLEGKIIKA